MGLTEFCGNQSFGVVLHVQLFWVKNRRFTNFVILRDSIALL